MRIIRHFIVMETIQLELGSFANVKIGIASEIGQPNIQHASGIVLSKFRLKIILDSVMAE